MLGKKDNNTVVGGQTLNTIIGRGTVFEGTMKVDNSVRIDGVFKGELSCSGSLTISQSGETHAQLEGKEVYINGVVRGTIRAEKVRLDSQALSVAEGAVLHGSCLMDRDQKEGDANGAHKGGSAQPEQALSGGVATN
jgi:cytoskeletal protein CcmA (bactofilin family)